MCRKDETRTIGGSFAPGGDPERGWPCWWYFRIDGIEVDEEITLRLRGSSAAIEKQKPLAASWAMPAQATYSIDGESWQHTAPGERQGEWMIYKLKPNGASLYVAWGPPYTPKTAEKFVRDVGERSSHATATVLCHSRDGRPVPMLHVREGQRESKHRFGVWVQARQHAWENWVSMNGNADTVSLCLETIWNSPKSTTTGYRAVGASLASAVQEYLAERTVSPPKLPQR